MQRNVTVDFRNSRTSPKTEISKQHKVIYDLFGTVPVFFLSVCRDYQGNIETVCLWQINKFCPYNRSQYSIQVDVQLFETTLYPQPSFLMLLRLEPEEGEQIVEAELLAEGKLMVKSTIGDSHTIFRTYNISEPYTNGLINPFKKTVKKQEYSNMLVVQREDPNTDSNWKITLYRPQTIAELDLLLQNAMESAAENTEEIHKNPSSYKIVDSKVMENSSSLSRQDILSKPYTHAYKDDIILFDSVNLRMVKFSSSSLHIINLPGLGKVKTIKKFKDSFLIIDQEDNMLELDLCKDTPEEGLMPIANLSSEIPSSENTSSWKIIKLQAQDSALRTPHAVYLKENKICAFPLDQSGNKAQVLVELNGNPEQISNLSWDVFSYKQNIGPSELQKRSVLVYLIGEELCFFDIATKREGRVKNDLKGKIEWTNYQIICAKIGNIYLRHSECHEQRCTIIAVTTPLHPDKLFGEKIQISNKVLVDDVSFESPDYVRRQIQIEGAKRQIKLVRLISEPFYEDDINRIYFRKPLLVNNLQSIKQSQVESSKNQALEAEDRDSVDNKEEAKQNIVKMAKETKKQLAETQSQQSIISKCDDTLANIRKGIKVQASEVWENDIISSQAKSKHHETYDRANAQEEAPEHGKSSPSRVSEEYLRAYKDIKDEKKKAARQREKEKSKKQDWKGAKRDTEF